MIRTAIATAMILLVAPAWGSCECGSGVWSDYCCPGVTRPGCADLFLVEEQLGPRGLLLSCGFWNGDQRLPPIITPAVSRDPIALNKDDGWKCRETETEWVCAQR